MRRMDAASKPPARADLETGPVMTAAGMQNVVIGAGIVTIGIGTTIGIAVVATGVMIAAGN